MADQPHLLLVLFLFLTTWRAAADAPDDRSVLLEFKTTTLSPAPGDWDGQDGPCIKNVSKWTGVYCDEDGRVSILRLESMNLSGTLNLDALSELPNLRSLSFSNNNLEGSIPDVTKLPKLKSIYLSMNRFAGEIPDGMFSASLGLKVLWLSQNNFSGSIPSSLTAPKKLTELRLDGNKFEGQIPALWQPNLQLVNVSFNDLEGPIPERLSNMNRSWFEGQSSLFLYEERRRLQTLDTRLWSTSTGNKNLCGPPLAVSCESSKKKFSPALLVVVILISVAALVAIVGVTAFLFRRRKKDNTMVNKLRSVKPETTVHLEADGMALGTVRYHEGEKKVPKEEKLLFVGERRGTFDIQDLLRASAEVLGSGNFGSSYKAILLDGPSVVVKRFKEMNGVSREDFQEHMRRLGRLSHPNLLPLVAYYYRKEEKLLISDYIPNGSLAHMLYGNRNSRTSPLDWPTRLKIIKGVARGLAYLYEELPTLTVPHGHLKSSNVLLDLSFEPILTDYALVPVMNKAHASELMVAYKSPECTQHGKPSTKSDVWSLGILMLEILTGRFPANHLRPGRAGTDLASWVSSVIREEWTGEVFDSTMKGTRNSEGEMLKLLRVAMACCETDVRRRCEMASALERIEELKERESDAEFSSAISEGEAFYSSKAITDDDFSFS
ncbi:hypothetical protein GW17_00055883 [Ensete ventricosum]|nr:hypothetical protein GW17_00055883 [Ensete ventricosum]